MFRIFLTFFILFIQIGRTQEFTDSNCEDGKCKYFFNIEEDGFYTFSSLIDSDFESGDWFFSLTTTQQDIRNDAIHFGAQISSDESQTASISFYLPEESSIKLKLTDYSRSLSEVLVKIYSDFDSVFSDDNSIFRQELVNEQIINIDENTFLPALDKGHYKIVFISPDSDKTGKLGASLYGLPEMDHLYYHALLESKTDNSVNFNKFESFIGLYLNAGKYVARTNSNSDLPNLLLKNIKQGNSRQVFNSRNVKNILNGFTADFTLSDVAFSADLQKVLYTYINHTEKGIYIFKFDNSSQINHFIGSTYILPEFEENGIYKHAFYGLDMNADGSQYTYSYYFSYDDNNGYDFKRNFVYLYNPDSNSNDVIFETSCDGMQMCQNAALHNLDVSMDDLARYVAIYNGTDSSEDPYNINVIDTENVYDDYYFESNTKDGILFPQLSSDGEQLLFSSDSNSLSANDNNPGNDVFIRTISGGSYKIISVLENNQPLIGHQYNPVFGNNDNYVLFSSNAGSQVALYLYDKGLGYSRKITDIGNNSQYAIDDAGKQIVFTSSLDFDKPQTHERNRLWLYDLDKKKLFLKASSDQKLTNPHISNDGNTLAVVAENDPNRGLKDKIFLIENQQSQEMIYLK